MTEKVTLIEVEKAKEAWEQQIDRIEKMSDVIESDDICTGLILLQNVDFATETFVKRVEAALISEARSYAIKRKWEMLEKKTPIK